MFKSLILTAFGLLISGSALAQAQSVDFSKYNHLDPQHIVPTEPLKRIISYYDSVKNKLRNPDFISVIDFTPKNTQKRYFLIDMRSGAVESFLVAHGEGSDPKQTGFARRFSNIENSFMSSLGIFVTTRDVFDGKNGISLRLVGLEKTNDQALPRAILVHGANYVEPERDPLGRSQGCFALENRFTADVIKKISGGSLMISWIDPSVKLDQ